MDKDSAKHSIGLLTMQLSLADMPARQTQSTQNIVLQAAPEPEFPDLSALMHMDRSSYWSSSMSSLPRRQMSQKERARRKKRREIAYESRKRNRRKK